MSLVTETKIEVFPPHKTSDTYKFSYVQYSQKKSHNENYGRKIKAGIKSFIGKKNRGIEKHGKEDGNKHFGFKALNFSIQHSAIWDSIYPLMFLTRNGGPLFKKYNSATIEFKYPILRSVRDFYIKRALDFGIDVDIHGPVYDETFCIPTSRNALAFGGGKDSRLISGILDEIGYKHTLYSCMNLKEKTNFASDTNAYISTPIGKFSLANRVITSLMSRSNKIYFGHGFGECGLHTPWLQYYDFSPIPLNEFSNLLMSLGLNTQCISPLAILPYNIIQKILYDRYPKLYEGQISVKNGEKSDKNLHISLCKAYHGIDFNQHCSDELFKALLGAFVQTQMKTPNDFGFRNYRETFAKEMRCIIYNMRDHSLLKEVGNIVPSHWGGHWIDYIHNYIYPDIDPEFLNILSKYAKGVEHCPLENRHLVPGYVLE